MAMVEDMHGDMMDIEIIKDLDWNDFSGSDF